MRRLLGESRFWFAVVLLVVIIPLTGIRMVNRWMAVDAFGKPIDIPNNMYCKKCGKLCHWENEPHHYRCLHCQALYDENQIMLAPR